jgi:phytoene/squalene synthetase
MSVAACAALVEKGDPDRFLATMAAPPAARARLFPLYAFNLEVARAPWITRQPLIAEMRLQFWRDVLEADAARAHEIAGPLHGVIHETGLDISVLQRMIDARGWDIARERHGSAEALSDYVEDTSAGLMWAAGQALGAPREAEPALRALGWASGLANYLRAVPVLKNKGLDPLPEQSLAAIRALAEAGLDKLRRARRERGTLGPAALSAWLAGPILSQAARQPERVLAGTLGTSEFTRRSRLLWAATTGRL